MTAAAMDIVSPKSPSRVLLSDIGYKGATVFLSHVRRTFARSPVDYTGELVRLLDDIANFTRVVSTAVTESNLVSEYSGHHAHEFLDVNAEGATQSLYRLLAHDGYCCIILSKGHKEPLTFPEGVPHGNYVVCVSPLDHDPVTGTGNGAATVFSIYKRRSSASLPGRGIDLKQKLSNQVAAGYCSYSSATTLHYTMGHGTSSFVMHPVAQQYFLQPATPLMIPENDKVVYCNRDILRADSSLGSAAKELLGDAKFSVSSSGCLLGDLHMLLRTGGVLIAQNVNLLCEAAPIAYLVEQSGGIAIDEFGDRILDMSITEEYDIKVTIVVGSKTDVGNVGDAIVSAASNARKSKLNGKVAVKAAPKK